ncbi:MAG: ABC transporter substrate-binding protein [Candidatus Nanopelagicales bacterium]
MRRRGLALLAPAAFSLALLVGCSTNAAPAPAPSGTVAPGFNEALGSVVNPSEETGGQLRVAVPGRCGGWNPQLTTSAACANLQRALSRQLTTYVAAPGRAGSVVTADLATELGQSDSEGMSWTFTLKPYLKWDDGSPLTTLDVARGLRNLDLRRADFRITDIEFGTNRTMIVRLDRPFHDFNAVVALTIAAPVARGEVVRFSGPFTIDRSNPSRLVRNALWDPATDSVRKPMVDGMRITWTTSQSQANQLLLIDDVDVALTSRTDPGFTASVLQDPARASHADNPGTGQVTMLAIPPSTGPLASEKCRQAVYSAVNRTALRQVLGASAGEANIGAAQATTLSAPTIASFDANYQPFSPGDGSGDVTAAAAALEACGQPQGFPMTLGFPDSVTGLAAFAVIKESLARVGITVLGDPINSTEYWATLLSSDTVTALGLDAVYLNYSASVPGVAGYWRPLTGSIAPGKPYRQNIARLDMPTVNALLASKEISSPDPKIQADVGRIIDRLVLDSGAYIPLAFTQTLEYRPAGLSNVATTGAFDNQYDIVNIGIAAEPADE